MRQFLGQLRGASECMRDDSKPNATQTCNTYKIRASTTLIYTTQPDKKQTDGLAIGANGKYQLRTCPMPKCTTTHKDPLRTRLIKLVQLHAFMIKPKINQT